MMLFFAGRGRDGRASRASIRAMVEAEPGIHVAELAERTGLSWHTIAYHLRLLEKQRLVSLEKGGRERRAFPAGIPALHRRWLAGLRADKAEELLRFLLEDPRQTVPSLSRRMGYSEKVVRRQVAHLAEAGLVERHGRLRPVYEVSPTASPELAEWLRRRGAAAPHSSDDDGGPFGPLPPGP